MCIYGWVSFGQQTFIDGDVTYFSGEGHEMVFAKAVDLNVFDDDHLGMSLVENRIVDDILQVVLVPFGQE